ncbi:MAG: O-antigen ligase-related protein [Candidatus Magasanikbacteria bacterium GW2011_GWA2_46_17]|uniref:O-antigen ligase-related protein n=1 Tax=Candidatus Magasanikbacteria bacterium GW2011_GWA2_46_17 TaxID=1619042 RepID=A0A0G1P3G0_9BACT|nr:MAG: O-antigen ligase-related protein [Candidatus Magasanikbacteria bacterium GW2011_GWA2_46_17]
MRFFASVGAFFVALVPWGTRLMYGASAVFPDGEWGRLSWYASEVVLWLCIICFVVRVVSSSIHSGVPRAAPWGTMRLALISLLLFFIFLFVRSLFVSDFDVALQWTVRVLGASVLFLLMSFLNEREFRLWLVVFFASAGAVGVFGIGQFLFQTSPANTLLGVALHDPSVLGTSVVETVQGRWLRAYGSFAHPNIVGAYGVVVWLLVIACFPRVRSAAARYGLHALGLSMVALVLLSFSRAAWLVGVCAVVVIGVYAFRKQMRMVYKTLLFQIALVCVVVVLFSPLFSVRLYGQARLEQRSFDERTIGLQTAAVLFKRHLLVGVGPAHSVAFLYQENPGREPWSYQPVHNVFLLAGSELGIVGIILIVCFLLLWSIHLPMGDRRFFLGALLILGSFFIFDHFWYTLPQGMFLAVLFLGFFPRVSLLTHK